MNSELDRFPTSGFATADEAGQFLNISRAMVHSLIHQGKIPTARFGQRCVRIPWEWLRAQAGNSDTVRSQLKEGN